MERENTRPTMLVITVWFLVVHLIFSWRWAVFVSLGAGITGILSPTLSRAFEKCWLAVTRMLGNAVSFLLLSFVFFLILLPIALLSRLFTRDPLMLSRRRKSFFVAVNRVFEKQSFEKTW